MYQQHMTVKIG